MIFFSSPKTQMGIALFLIFLTALIHNFSFNLIAFLLLILSSTIISDLIFTRIRKVPFSLPVAALVSGLIIALLANPNSSWHQLLTICVISMASKNWLRIANHHIFNPAMFGLFLSSLLFNNIITWWGVSFQQFSIFNFQFSIYFIALLSPLLISAFRMRRYRIQLSFLLTYIIIGKILNSQFSILNSVLDSSLIFFLSVILPEPMTSPNNRFRQVLFGLSVAILVFILSSPILNFQLPTLNSLDSLIFALLLSNLIFFKLK